MGRYAHDGNVNRGELWNTEQHINALYVTRTPLFGIITIQLMTKALKILGGGGVIQAYHCMNCGAEYELTIPEEM